MQKAKWVMKRAAQIVAATGVSMTVAVGQAWAALPAGISDSIDDAAADGLILVGLLAAGGASVYLISKVLARFGIKL